MQSCTDSQSSLNIHQVVAEPKMSNTDPSFIKLHRINGDGTVKSVKYEVDNISKNILSQTAFSSDLYNIFVDYDELYYNSEYFQFNEQFINVEDEPIKIVKYNYNEVPFAATSNETRDLKPIINNMPISYTKRETRIPNIPTMIVCQNCDTNFPTKYQYQRHQCEFNAEKVVLKPNADLKDVDKGMRTKFDCSTCGKQFVSKNNLERHQTSHDETNVNICEHCQKHFVSENRLRIHKENHCKKAGDISKFYRSDVAVWKCLKCNRVFATAATANKHAENCAEYINKFESQFNNAEDNEDLTILNEEIKNLRNIAPEITNEMMLTSNIINKHVEKVLTELLLQCEFCNRTYAEKKWLLCHQKTHTTEINYQCVKCNESFDSYIYAAKHWLTKCSDEANLFYLPKLTYCEYCDRTFKSHDILYTHKIKKKHYTPKMFVGRVRDETLRCSKESNEIDNKNAIVKLIEDALLAMKVPEQEQKLNDNLLNIGETRMPQIKSEILSETNSLSSQLEMQSQENGDVEKKRRGRKRKWPKQANKNKKIASTVESGCKYQCERCVKTFDTVANLENHRDTEHPTNFKCEECCQVVHSAKALLIHSRAHQSLKPYVCEICKRCYSQTSHLWQHMRFHQGIKPFACPHEGCEARYTIRPDLKDHIRKVHTRERPFKCSVCNKCFLTGSVYYQHRLIHTNDRRYGCDICQKRFFRADALNNHRRIHTDERPYPCEICGRQFRQKGDRNKHVRTQHPL